MWEEIQILVCQAALLTCCFRLSSQGGSFANTHSRLAASFACNTFMFECASFSLPLGSYNLAMNLWAQTIEVFSSSPPMKTSSAKESTPFSEIVLYTEFFPIPKKTDVESHHVRAWIAGKTFRHSDDCEWHMSCTGMNLRRSVVLVTVPVSIQNSFTLFICG